ncbi:MAG: nodulation protein NfeD [Proteobacteria bacterium]|nr:nodulation protein NfeD [Pseudomonadota bacterium]
MPGHLFKLIILLSAISLLLLPARGDSVAQTGSIWLIDIEGAIGPATSDHVIRGMEQAVRSNAPAVIIRMNTPGGLDSAMRDIIQNILASDVPVIAYVGPKGARAASAGTYIAYASHVSAMAPATNLGAATPVQIAAPSMPGNPSEADGESGPAGSTAMERKMINDASAYIRGLADLRGRNADWAEQAVRQAASLDAEEALEAGVIDLVALDIQDLLDQLEGRVVTTDQGEVTLKLVDRDIHIHEPDWRTEILSIITNPSIVLVLGMIGIYGVILEFYNPGSLIPGVTGIICLLLAAYAVQLLPLNYAGLALLVLGIALMVAEAMVPSFGILGIGGMIAFAIGGLMLFDTEMEAFKVGIPALAATMVVSAVLIFATVNIAMKVRKQRVKTGEYSLLGESGIALEDFDREGQVRVGAEIWKARADTPVNRGDRVEVIAINGLELQVTAHQKQGETA